MISQENLDYDLLYTIGFDYVQMNEMNKSKKNQSK